MKCKNCGYENQYTSKYCGQCGWELSREAETGNGQQNDKGKKRGKGKFLKRLLLGVGILFSIVLIISLFSGPSVADVEAEIDAIGKVTINSEEHLKEIVEMCEKLSPEKQMQIRNLDVLVKASEEYARQAEVIADAMNAINDLGEITLDSKDVVSSARKKYDQAKVYDLNNIMKGHVVLLEAAEEKLEVLIEEQERSLEYALSDIDDVVAKLLSGEYEGAKSRFTERIEKLQKDSDRKQYADTFLAHVCKRAQKLYDDGSYVTAVTALQHYDDFADWASKKTVSETEKLKDFYVEELNSKAPKNGEVLERTFSKGTNSFTITVGPADTCVKIEAVDDPDEYAIMYIWANEKATLYNIKSDVEFCIKYATGPVWYGEEELFGPDATYILWEETIKPEANNMGSYRTWTTYTWKISYGYGSDYGVQNMDSSDF